MEQLNSSSPIITSTHLYPPLTSPALSIDGNVPSIKLSKERRKGVAGPRTINPCFSNGLYGCPFPEYNNDESKFVDVRFLFNVFGL